MFILLFIPYFIDLCHLQLHDFKSKIIFREKSDKPLLLTLRVHQVAHTLQSSEEKRLHRRLVHEHLQGDHPLWVQVVDRLHRSKSGEVWVESHQARTPPVYINAPAFYDPKFSVIS